MGHGDPEQGGSFPAASFRHKSYNFNAFFHFAFRRGVVASAFACPSGCPWFDVTLGRNFLSDHLTRAQLSLNIWVPGSILGKQRP